MLINHYHPFSKLLHWLIAALIVLQYVLGELAEDATSDLAALALWANHKSVGMTVLVLALIRLGWRLTHNPPALPEAIPAWQKLASNSVHWLIYALIFALPLSGWLMSSASAYSVSWFNLFAFPDLIGPSEVSAERLASVHHFMAEALFIVVLLHAAAALKHHFVDRDDVMKRMLSTTALVLFAATIAAGVVLLTRAPVAVAGSTPGFGDAAERGGQPSTDFRAGGADAWVINYDNSEIRFTGEQAGASFTGVFDSWQADIRFDPTDLANSSAEVTIELASVNSQDSDRDDTARGSDWFDIANTPTATYRASQFERTDTASFIAKGELTIRGVTANVPLSFTLVAGAGVTSLSGTATIERLAMFNLGTGDWVDTSWVGENFQVDVSVVRINAGQ